MEAAAAGNLERAVLAVPPAERERAAEAAREGFLTGLNDVLAMGAGLALVGAVVAVWLVRQREIARGPAPAAVKGPTTSR